MWFQRQLYRDNLTVTRGGTTKLDLPKTGVLSFLYLIFYGTQAAGAPYYDSAQGIFKLIDTFTDISVIANGRADIVSATGPILQYLAFLDQGVTAYDKVREYSAASQDCQVLINFGTRMWDPKYALDLSQFDNVELDITNDQSSTYWADANSVDVYCGWLRGTDVGAGANFFKKEVWRNITTVQDAWDYLEVPTGLSVRRLGVQPKPAYNSTTGMCECPPNNLMYDLQLFYQSGAVAVFDADWLTLALQNYYEEGKENIVHGSSYHNADKGFDIGLGDVRGFASISGARDGAVSSSVPTREGDNSYPTQKLENYEADSPVDYIARGIGYQNCAHFAYDRLPDMADILDPSKSGQGIVELNIHVRNASSAASGHNRVFLDRLCNVRQLGQ